MGAVNLSDDRWNNSNFGNKLDLFAPGENVLSAGIATDTRLELNSGTSMASPHVAGAVTMYLQGRDWYPNNYGADCFSMHSQASGGAPDWYYTRISTCPDRVSQFIKSNATLNKLNSSSLGSNSPNRLLSTSSFPAPLNPIDNQRFYVWQQYADFLPELRGFSPPEPDETGLDYWSGQVSTVCGYANYFNENDACTHEQRIIVSREFWVDQHPSLFSSNYSLNSGKNSEFVHLCYQIYLRRDLPDTDTNFLYWLGQLNLFGDPASPDGVHYLIDQFTNSTEYRHRFGPA